MDADGDASGQAVTLESSLPTGSHALRWFDDEDPDTDLVLELANVPRTPEFPSIGRIPMISGYQLSVRAPATAAYTSFSFSVRSNDQNSVQNYTATINIVADATAATGMPVVTAAGGTAYDEDVELTAALGSIFDLNNIDVSTLVWQWQVSDTAGGDYADIAGATATTFTPVQAQAGQYLRVCASFMDMYETPTAERRCTDGELVSELNDLPVAMDSSVSAPFGDAGYVFVSGDFPFTDEEGDALAAVRIETLPADGTLSGADGAVITAGTSVISADALAAGELRYTPPPAVMGEIDDYSSFTFSVLDAFGVSAEPATLTINIVPPGPIAATGAPSVTAASGTAYNEDVALTATTAGIIEPNGINTATLSWVWQQSATQTSGYTPISGATATGVTSTSFTPLQEHVGLYIRACVSFMDMFSTPASEGPLCSDGAMQVSVNVTVMRR